MQLCKHCGMRRPKGALVETPGALVETPGPKHQARWSKHQGPTSNRTPVPEVREAIAKLGIIALEYMSTKADGFVQNVLDEMKHHE